MTKNAFHLYLPESRTTSVVFASPHSGRLYPAEFLNASILDERLIRTSEDAFVDLLLEQVTAFGAPLQRLHSGRLLGHRGGHPFGHPSGRLRSSDNICRSASGCH